MKTLPYLLLFLYIGNKLAAQEALKDTTVFGKTFHVIIYNDSNRVICVGNYIPNTFIRNGEWDYFYDDKNLYAKTFFTTDRKTGVWVYYDEQGRITRKMNPHKKIRFFRADEVAITSVFYEDAQQNKEAFDRQFQSIQPYVRAMLEYSLYRNISGGGRRRNRSFNN